MDKRPLKVPVFENLDNLYDSELDFYIKYWREVRIANGTFESYQKCGILKSEFNRRQKET